VCVCVCVCVCVWFWFGWFETDGVTSSQFKRDRTKQQLDVAQASYTKAKADFDAFLKAL
jgi:hypothetical protein